MSEQRDSMVAGVRAGAQCGRGQTSPSSLSASSSKLPSSSSSPHASWPQKSSSPASAETSLGLGTRLPLRRRVDMPIRRAQGDELSPQARKPVRGRAGKRADLSTAGRSDEQDAFGRIPAVPVRARTPEGPSTSTGVLGRSIQTTTFDRQQGTSIADWSATWKILKISPGQFRNLSCRDHDLKSRLSPSQDQQCNGRSQSSATRRQHTKASAVRSSVVALYFSGPTFPSSQILSKLSRSSN